MQKNRLNLYLLGSPQIELDNQPVEIRLHKALALLVFLATTRQNHRRDSLAAFFWPDCNQGQARSYLRNALWVLKESLGESWFNIHREEVALQPEASIWVDVDTFRQYLKAVELHRSLHLSNDLCQSCIDHLTNAVHLYRDDFLSGFTLRDSPAFDEWQDFHCEDLRQGFSEALERIAMWHGGQGNPPASITFARRLVLLDPFNENARRILMEAYYKTGHRGDALQQYQDYVQILRRELNVSPSIEISELYNLMKAGTFVQSGLNHLGTAKGAEKLRPLQPGGSPASSSDFLIGNPPVFIPPITLPKPVPFVKRENELAKLEELLRVAVSGYGKSIFISGSQGSGKTTLVLEFVRCTQQKYSDVIVSGGNCLPQTSSESPYAIFQEVLNLLAGELEQRWAGGILTGENLNRLFTFLPTVLQTLVDSSPDLITTFLPALNLSSKVWAYKNQSPKTASLLVKLFLQDFQPEKIRTLDQNLICKQYLKTLQVLSVQQPLLLILEDLQWVDPSSIRLLSHLCKHIGDSRIMIIGTYCPLETEHPFIELLNELESQDDRFLIDLDQAGNLQGQEFTNAYLALEPNHLSERFKKEIYEITGGQPLFLSEYLQELKENGDLRRDDENYWVDLETFYDRENQPGCLDSILATRISRLPGEIRKAIDIASVEGIEFSIETVARVLEIDHIVLIQLFMRKTNHQPIVVPLSLYQSGPQHLSWFRFRHSLFQKVVYNQFTKTERAHFHAEIGASLEQIYGDKADEISNQLAWHFQEAVNIDKAVYYLEKASNHARRLGANQEALQLFQKREKLLQGSTNKN